MHDNVIVCASGFIVQRYAVIEFSYPNCLVNMLTVYNVKNKFKVNRPLKLRTDV